MGKVEKVVVLSVLFLMVVIFAVSIPDGTGSDVEKRRVFAGEKEQQAALDSPGAGQGSVLPADRWNEASGAQNGTRQELAGTRQRNSATQLGNPTQRPGSAASATERVLPQDPAADRSADRNSSGGALPKNLAAGSATGRTSGLLSADVRLPERSRPTTEPKATAQDRPVQPGLIPAVDAVTTVEAEWDLVTTQGLSRTPHPDYMAYTAATGDTFETIAKRFYGNGRHAGYLRRNNEGVRAVTPGQVIVVPCQHVAPGSLTYRVQPGDSLWTIARDHYGAGNRWKEVYEANRSLLRSPDDLKAGQELQIP